MSEIDWYWEGSPQFDKITELQKLFLVPRKDEVLTLLTDVERINTRIIGYEEWLDTLDKFEATDLIGEIRDGKITKRIAEREEFRRGKYKELFAKQKARDAGLRAKLEGRNALTKRKWWDTRLKKDSFLR